MLKFKDYLTELFDKPVPFHRVSDDEWEFIVNKSKYQVDIGIMDDRDEDGDIIYHGHDKYYIQFSALVKKQGILHDYISHTYEFNDALKGNANQVISTIVAICKEHFSKNKLKTGDQLTYTGSTPSKMKLYKALVTRFLKETNIKFKYHYNGFYESDIFTIL